MTGMLALEAGGGHGEFSALAAVLGLVLLIGNGFFVAAEIALLAARRGRVEEAAEQGDPRAQRALAQLSELSVTFTGAQLGITMCSLGLGIVAEPAVESLVTDALGFSPLPAGAVPAVAFVLALGIVVFLHMVIGEMAPKNLAIARAEQVAFRISRVFGWYAFALRPLILLLNGLANALVRLVGVEPVDEHRMVHTADELTSALAESRDVGSISLQDARIMGAALRLSTMTAGSAMTPRVDVHTLEDTATRQEILSLASATGHTRFPVYRGDIDHIVGVVNVKDVLCHPERTWTTAGDLMRHIPAVPEFRDLERLLNDMLDERSHAVVVVDERGGTAGLITLEDVLEELVGEIADEFDDEVSVAQQTERTWVVPGLIRRDELERLTGLALDEGRAATVSGFIVERTGRLPRVGDRVQTASGWSLTVTRLDGLRAAEIEVRSTDVKGSSMSAPTEQGRSSDVPSAHGNLHVTDPIIERGTVKPSSHTTR